MRHQTVEESGGSVEELRSGEESVLFLPHL